MDNVFVGKLVNTHGIKGEVRIKSDFELKSKVFAKDSKVIIKGKEFVIDSYRVHKDFDMVTFVGYDNINDILYLKGSNVFVKREELKLDSDDYILSDLINLDIICGEENLGVVVDYTTGVNPLLCVEYNDRQYYIPLKGEFISNVDINNHKVEVNESVKGLIL